MLVYYFYMMDNKIYKDKLNSYYNEQREKRRKNKMDK